MASAVKPNHLDYRCARLVLKTARYRGQRSACQMGNAALAPPLFAALGLSCRRSATAGIEALGRWGLPPSNPCFPLRSAFVLQTARYRGQQNAWQVGAAASILPLSAAPGLSCRRLATAGNEALVILRAHLRTRIKTTRRDNYFWVVHQQLYTGENGLTGIIFVIGQIRRR